jgi:hypothetical protein
MEAVPTLLLVLMSFPVFGFAIIKIAGMMLEHEIEAVPGIVAIGMCLAMFGTVAISKHPWIHLATIVVAATLLAFYPYAAKQFALTDHLKINRESIEKHYLSWSMRPDNSAAALALSDSLYKHGFRATAIGISSSVLGGYSKELDLQSLRAPRDAFRNEDYRLKQWLREFDVESAAPIRCPFCSTPNDPARLECESCGKAHILELVRGGPSSSSVAGKLILGWAMVAGLLVGTVAASALPMPVSLILIFVGFGSVFATLGLLFKRGKFDQMAYQPMVED